MIIRKLDKFQSFHQDAAGAQLKANILRGPLPIDSSFPPPSVVVSDIGVSRRQIVDRDPLIVANVGLLVVFFGPNDLLTSFARFLIGDVAALEASAQSLVDDGDRVKLEEPHQGIASSTAIKVGFSFF